MSTISQVTMVVVSNQHLNLLDDVVVFWSILQKQAHGLLMDYRNQVSFVGLKHLVAGGFVRFGRVLTVTELIRQHGSTM